MNAHRQTVSDEADFNDEASNLSVESERVSNIGLTPFSTKRFTLVMHQYLQDKDNSTEFLRKSLNVFSNRLNANDETPTEYNVETKLARSRSTGVLSPLQASKIASKKKSAKTTRLYLINKN